MGSESLLDTLEDLSNYAALTACWLKGVRAENGETSSQKVAKFIFGNTECTDMSNVINYNVKDAKETVEFRTALDKPFKHLGREVVHLPEPNEYILKMLDDINRVVQMKLEKDELLVPMDISDEAGLIAKCIVQSGTRSESISIIKDYLFDNSKNIPFEIREWIYGVIMRHFYYINKEHNEAFEIVNENKQRNEASEYMEAIMTLLVANINMQRNPKIDLDTRVHCTEIRRQYYKDIAALILSTQGLDFESFRSYFQTRSDLTPDEKQMVLEGVVEEIYSQTDKNPGSDEESEFRSKTFNIPPQEKEEKEPLNEKMFKAVLWLFHPIIDMNYRGDDND